MTTNAASMAIQHTGVTAQSSPWAGLYWVGGTAALLTAAFLPIQIAVFFIIPPPNSVSGWFQLFQSNRLGGLLDLDLLLMVDQVLTVIMFLALYILLRHISPSFLLIGAALGLFSTVLFIASNPAFAMESLSRAYAAAGTQAEKDVLVAAGQATMAQWQGSAFQVSYLIGSLASILISIIMLRSGLFSRVAAWMGIASNALALGLYVPVIGVYVSIFSVVFLWAWYLLTGLGLIRWARSTSTEPA